MKKANYVLESLRARGYRITDSRTEIIELLAMIEGPVTVKELVRRYKEDPVVVYRTLDVLKKEHLVTIVSVPGDVDRYELVGHHHHHVVCERCHTIAAVPCLEVGVPEKFAAKI